MRALALGLLLAASPAAAQEGSSPPTADGARPVPGVEAGVEIDAVSVYLFRGLVYSHGPVTQSKAWVSAGGLHLYAWSNVAVPPAAQARRLDEVDFGASYAFERGNLTVEPAFDCYLYRLSDPEVEATVSTRQVLDAGSYRGAYFGELGASYDRAVSSRVEIGVSAWVGWASSRFNREYIGPEDATLGLVGAGVSVTRTFGRHLYLKPHAEITTVPVASLRAHLDRPTNVVVGLAIGVVR
jgi:hypothetical protein